MLCRTTYEDYSHRFLDGLINKPGPAILETIKKNAAEIAVLMQAGDELWEWESGDGKSFSGAGGVAIVRDGKVVLWNCQWRS